MNNLETQAQAATRLRRDGPRKPLRSLKELAEEFGVTRNSLVLLLKNRNGPKPKLQHGAGNTFTNTWYDPDEMRKWWRDGGKP